MEAARGGVGREAGGRGFPCAKVPAGPQRSHIHAHPTTASPLLATKAPHTPPVQLQRVASFPSLRSPQSSQERREETAGAEGSGVGLGWTCAGPLDLDTESRDRTRLLP